MTTILRPIDEGEPMEQSFKQAVIDILEEIKDEIKDIKEQLVKGRVYNNDFT